MLEPWAWQYKAWKKRAAWALFQRHDLCTAQALHATSREEAENLGQLFPTIPVAVIPLGVGRTAIWIGYGKKKHCLNLRKNRFWFLSRLHPKKRDPEPSGSLVSNQPQRMAVNYCWAR